MGFIQIKIQDKEIIHFCQQFQWGNSKGIAASVDIDGLVLFSPVLDYHRYNENGDEQDLDQLVKFVKRAYKNLYRIKWNSLKRRITTFKECNPDEYIKRIKVPVLVLHDPRDKVVSIRRIVEIKRKLRDFRIIKHNYGHGMRQALIKKWRYVERFLRQVLYLSLQTLAIYYNTSQALSLLTQEKRN